MQTVFFSCSTSEAGGEKAAGGEQQGERTQKKEGKVRREGTVHQQEPQTCQRGTKRMRICFLNAKNSMQPFVCNALPLAKVVVDVSRGVGVGCHPLGTTSIPDFTAIWPVFELSHCGLKCWTDGWANQLDTEHR